jgi:RNA-directed DNA polymerase
MLTLRNTWFENGHKFVRWSSDTSGLLKHVKTVLYDQLKPHLSRRCSHIKGHGGVKLSVRYSQRLCNHFGYVARFDVKSYYSSMDHQIILNLLKQYQVTPAVISIVSEYLSLPDHNKSGKGMVAGGAISPLIGALYLMPLDKLMEGLQATTGIRYQRYMDDYVIFAPTRHKLRKAIKLMYAVLDDLKVEVHPKKRFIGTTRRGFDFLGYWLEPHKPLTPSQVSLTRLIDRSRQLLERTASIARLRQYVRRWLQWHHSGLRGLTARSSSLECFWQYVTKALKFISS